MGFQSLFCGFTSLIIHLYGDQTQLETCDSKTRTRLFFGVLLKSRHLGKCFFSPLFSQEKLKLLFLLKEVKPSPHRKITKLLTFDNI